MLPDRKRIIIMKKYILTFTLMATALILSSYNGGKADSTNAVEEGEKVQWMTWEQAIERSNSDENPKKIFVDAYTDWCGWCKRMDATTFSHPMVAKYMNEHFYPVKLDAEQKEDIVYKGHTFKFVEQGRRGYHELAASLLQGKMSYPTVIFLDEEQRLLSPVPGYQPAEGFYKILTYFGNDAYKKTDWETYQKSYQSPF